MVDWEMKATKEYRGWTIHRGWVEWTATSPNYDASYEGPEDGWVSSGGYASAATYEALIIEIDNAIDAGAE